MICELNNLGIIGFGFPGGWEWIVVAFIGLLVFGKRLPEVGKSLGRSIVEFKKGLKSVEDDIDRAVEHDQNDMLPPPDSTDTTETSSEPKESAEPVTPTNSTETPA
jgi:sec-independent protein translocase protein TatA